ncbi:hypothetical protein F5X97DRAFT_310315 [Nemania serpens]|nr:hypothetical protein F5X97DRAFT_310315 [Nemania serpens]
MALPFLPPASLDSSFTMSCPTKANIDALVKVYYDSFESEPSNTWWWPQDPDAMLEWIRDRIRRKMSDHNVRHFQVLDQQGEVVSFARWDIPKGYEAKFGEWVGSDDDEGALDVSRIVEGGEDDIAKPAVTTAPVEEIAPAAAKTMPAPRGADPELCQYFFTELARLSKKWNATEMLGLSLLCTSPKYYRRGAAKALLVPMLAIADASGLQSYLEATPAGRPVYEKLGFKTVEVKEFNGEVLTGGRVKGDTNLYIMIREPQPS